MTDLRTPSDGARPASEIEPLAAAVPDDAPAMPQGTDGENGRASLHSNRSSVEPEARLSSGEGDDESTPVPVTSARRGRWKKACSIGLFGFIVTAAIIGGVLAWQATGKEEYPPLVAGWALTTPLAALAAILAVRRKPLGARRPLRLTSAAVAVVVVGGLGVATKGVDPCDKRGAGVVLRGCNLTGRDLHGKNLAHADLTGVNLSKANIRGADLSGAVLVRARLTGADLRRANLAGAKLADAVLDRANLTDAKLDNASLTAAALVKAQLVRAALDGIDLAKANLAEANLSGARGAGVTMAGAELPGAVLEGASFPGGELTGANLSGARLTKVDLTKAKAGGANLSGATVAGTDLHDAVLTSANLGGARLSDVNLARADLTGASMRGVEMNRVDLDSAKLGSTVDLEDSALAGALSVDPAKVSRAASLRGVQFETPDHIASKLGAACSGTPIAGTRAYSDSGEFHAGVVLNGMGKVSETGPLRQLRAVARDGKWAPAGLRYAELVACVDDQESRLVQDCGTYTERTSGDRRNFHRIQLTRRIRVVSVATGQAALERTFLGSAPRACNPTESAPFGTGPHRITGDEPSSDEMASWLTQTVKPSKL